MVDIAAGEGLDDVAVDDTAPNHQLTLRRRGPPPAVPVDPLDSFARRRTIEETSQEGVLIIDADNRVTHANRIVTEMLGYGPDDMLGSDLFRFTDDEGKRATLEHLDGHRRATANRFDVRCTHRDGHDVQVSVRCTQVFGEGGQRIGAVASLVDVTAPYDAARERFEHSQLASDRRFHEFIDHMPAVVYMKGIDGQILLHNRKADELWNANMHADDGDVDDALVPLHATQSSRDNDASVAASAAAHTFLETAELPDGKHWYSSIKFPVFDTAGDVYGVGAITRDITDRKKVDEELSEAYRQLERRALHDSLTGLPNRAQLLERLASLDRSRLLVTALLFVDLDDFKDVNDTHGHAAGDKLLRTAAARMRTCIRPTDVLARLGGDEFAVLLEGADTVAAESLALRIVDAMNTPFDVGGQQSRVTASVGIAVGTIADTTPDELLRHADLAMYEAKSRGKGRYASFDAAMSDALMLRTRTENELREAIADNGLELYYQPIVDLSSGEMAGVEALVRWQHPVRGLLGPDEFVPLAERTGLIVALGAWVLRDACRQASKWQALRLGHPGLFISVNVSARQLDDPVFVSTVSDALRQTGLDPASLYLEITETAVMANPERAQEAVQPLQDLGVELAIDDFGTGYASLTYLRRLRAGAVKIDRSFVDGLGREPEDTAIVSAVIGLAHAMGLSVTAEGIETTEQLLILRDMGCQYAQGFLMCPPVPVEALTRQLEQRWRYDAPALGS